VKVEEFFVSTTVDRTNWQGLSDNPNKMQAQQGFMINLLLRGARLQSWRMCELLLCLVLVIGRMFLLGKTFGRELGFDTGGHLWEVENFSFERLLDLDLSACVYDYHPPIAFMAAKLVSVIFHTDAIKSIQVVSSSASLVAFFFMRATLARIRLLENPAAIAFLYLSSCSPLQIFLAHSINIDVITLAECSVTIYLSVSLFWQTQCDARQLELRNLAFYAGLTLIIVLAMFTKFTGVLLTPIPFLIYYFSPDRSNKTSVNLRIIRHIALAVCASALLVTPYYFLRYIPTTGDIFPNNFIILFPDLYAEACAKRDADRFKFFATLFGPSKVHKTKGYAANDLKEVHLSDTWKDFWVKNSFLKVNHGSAAVVEQVYLHGSPFLLLLGLLAFWRQGRKKNHWHALGAFLLTYSCFLFAVLIANIYRNPYTYWYPAKAIYVAPVTWAIGYLLACLQPLINSFAFRALVVDQVALRLRMKRQAIAVLTCFSGLALYIVLNSGLPIY
jgi:hypothetical protein